MKSPDKQLPPKAIERLAQIKEKERGPRPLTPFQLRVQRARVTKPLIAQHRLFEHKGRLLCTCRTLMGLRADLTEAKWKFHLHLRAVRQTLEQGT